MVNLAEWDSLAVENKTIGKAGRLPKNAPIEKVVDELQRQVATLQRTVHQLLRHNRIGPDWNALAAPPSQARYVSLAWNKVATVTINGVAYNNGFVFSHNAGFILSNFVIVRKTYETSVANPTMAHDWRIALETKDYTLLQVSTPFVNNRTIIDLIFWAGLEVSTAREQESAAAFAGFQGQGPIQAGQSPGAVVGTALQATPPPPADPTFMVDLGVDPKISGSFQITTATLTAGAPVFVYQVPRDTYPDETEMDRISCSAKALSATLLQVYWVSFPGPVAGTHKFAYIVGD